MLNKAESLVLDERYRSMIEKSEPTGGLINFEEAMATLTSGEADIDNLHRVTILLRKYLSNSSSRIPFQYQKRLILRLIELSLQQQYRQLRYQALLALINIAFISQMPIQLIKNGTLQLFFSFIGQEDIQLSRLAMCGIGQIAAGCHWKEIGQEGLKRLLEFQKISKDQKTNEVLLWALACLLKFYHNKVKYEAIVALLPAYHKVPQYVSQVWVRTIWYYFQKDKISALFESGTVHHLLNYLHSQNKKLSGETLAVIAMIINAGDQYIDRLIDLDLIDHIVRLLEKSQIHSYHIAYLLSCLSQSANKSCKRLVAQSDVILRKLLAMPYKQPNGFSQKVGVCCFFYNIIPLANPFRMYSLFKQFNFVRVFLDETEPRFIERLVKFLPVVLDLGQRFKENGKNFFVERLKAEGALEKWEYRLQCKDESLASTLLLILQKFSDS